MIIIYALDIFSLILPPNPYKELEQYRIDFMNYILKLKLVGQRTINYQQHETSSEQFLLFLKYLEMMVTNCKFLVYRFYMIASNYLRPESRLDQAQNLFKSRASFLTASINFQATLNTLRASRQDFLTMKPMPKLTQQLGLSLMAMALFKQPIQPSTLLSLQQHLFLSQKNIGPSQGQSQSTSYQLDMAVQNWQRSVDQNDGSMLFVICFRILGICLLPPGSNQFRRIMDRQRTFYAGYRLISYQQLPQTLQHCYWLQDENSDIISPNIYFSFFSLQIYQPRPYSYLSIAQSTWLQPQSMLNQLCLISDVLQILLTTFYICLSQFMKLVYSWFLILLSKLIKALPFSAYQNLILRSQAMTLGLSINLVKDSVQSMSLRQSSFYPLSLLRILSTSQQPFLWHFSLKDLT